MSPIQELVADACVIGLLATVFTLFGMALAVVLMRKDKP